MEGYLLCVFGDNDIYYKLSVRIIDNIRKFDKERSICILTDKIDRYVWPEENILIRVFELEKHIHPNVTVLNDWNKYGFYPKLFQSIYSPFEYTMYMDVDMMFYQDFTFIWGEYHKQNQIIMVPGKSDENNRSPADWHWGKINDVMEKLKIPIPQVSSTILVYKNTFAELLEPKIVHILDNLNNWNVQFQFREGIPDEIIYSILLGFYSLKINQYVHDWIFYDSDIQCNPCCKL